MIYFAWHSLILSLCLLVILSRKSGAISSRNPRHLVFPSDGTIVELLIGLGMPVTIQDQMLTAGPLLRFVYPVPENATVFTDAVFGRGKRFSTRWDFYSRLESTCDSVGIDGKACILRAICEAADVTVRYNGLAGEILHVLLTPSSTSESQRRYLDREYHAAERLGAIVPGSCHLLYPECNTGLLDIISTVELD